MSYEMLQDKLMEAIRGYYPNGKFDVREVFLALKMIEISLQATFIQTVAQGVLNTKEPAAQSGEGAQLTGDKSEPADITPSGECKHGKRRGTICVDCAGGVA